MPLEGNNRAIKIALIGCGKISETYLQVVTKMPECRLIAVVDVCGQIAENIAREHSCKAYSDYTQILEGNDIEAVIICTPPDRHAEIALFFLENKINVLCEKPFAINFKQASQMLEKGEEKNCVLMMASKFRYVDDVIKAKSIINSGILGNIIFFENVFCSRINMGGRWNSKKEISGGGVLIDNGSHSVDIVRYLIGPIKEIQMEKGRRLQNLEVEDTAYLYFKTESGILGTAALSWSINKEQESYVDIIGSEGILSIGWKGSKLKQKESPQWVSFGKGYDKNAAFFAQIKNFIATIKGFETPLINGKDGLESVKVIEAAYESSEMNKWIRMDSRHIGNRNVSQIGRLHQHGDIR